LDKDLSGRTTYLNPTGYKLNCDVSLWHLNQKFGVKKAEGTRAYIFNSIQFNSKAFAFAYYAYKKKSG
jgi:hypothetical protein